MTFDGGLLMPFSGVNLSGGALRLPEGAGGHGTLPALCASPVAAFRTTPWAEVFLARFFTDAWRRHCAALYIYVKLRARARMRARDILR